MNRALIKTIFVSLLLLPAYPCLGVNSPVTVLSDMAAERSVYRVPVTVFDLDGNAVVPNSLTWTLTDNAGNVINNRAAVSVPSPGSPENIILSGGDLDVSETASKVERVLLIEAVYTEGGNNNTPYNHEYRFVIRNLVGVSPVTGTPLNYDTPLDYDTPLN